MKTLTLWLLISPLSFGQKSVESLHSDSLKEQFLRSIFESDQQVRQEADAALLQINENKSASIQAEKKVWETDSVNAVLIDQYIGKYGFTAKRNWSYQANYAIWVVIHHAADLKYRLKHFPMLKQAVLDEMLDEESFIFYACRSFQLETNETDQSCFDSEINGLFRRMQQLYDEKK